MDEYDKFSDILKGKTVKCVRKEGVKEDATYGFTDELELTDMPNAIIEFNDGTHILFWYSEWGGIGYRNKGLAGKLKDEGEKLTKMFKEAMNKIGG